MRCISNKCDHVFTNINPQQTLWFLCPTRNLSYPTFCSSTFPISHLVSIYRTLSGEALQICQLWWAATCSTKRFHWQSQPCCWDLPILKAVVAWRFSDRNGVITACYVWQQSSHLRLFQNCHTKYHSTVVLTQAFSISKTCYWKNE